MLDTKNGRPIAENFENLDQYAPAPRPMFGLESLLRHKKVLVLSTALFLVLGLLFALLKTVTYTASTQLLIYNRELLTGPDSVILPGRADVALVQNQVEIIQSRNVLLKVIDALNLKEDPEYSPQPPGLVQSLKNMLSFRPSPPVDENSFRTSVALESVKRKLAARRVGNSHTILVSFTASSPNKAARIANEVARTYLQELTRGWEISKAPALRERFQGLGPSAHVISEAAPPIRRDGQSTTMIGLVAALLGLGVGAACAVALDFKDRSIRSAEQVEYLLGLECLGVIPRLRGRMTRAGEFNASTWAMRHPHSPFGEALRRVQVAMQESPAPLLRSLGVTSAVPGEGATTVAINLAHMIASSGQKVLLVDAVRGNPSISRLAGSGSWQEPVNLKGPHALAAGVIVHERVIVDERSGLHVLPLGGLSDAAPDSVWRTALVDLIREASQSYDLVMVDMPSLASGADVRAAAQALDGFLLVMKWGDTDSELIQQAVQSAGKAQAKFVGAVLNMADEQMIAKYGDKLSAAETALAAKRSLKSRSQSAEPAGAV